MVGIMVGIDTGFGDGIGWFSCGFGDGESYGEGFGFGDPCGGFGHWGYGFDADDPGEYFLGVKKYEKGI